MNAIPPQFITVHRGEKLKLGKLCRRDASRSAANNRNDYFLIAAM